MCSCFKSTAAFVSYIHFRFREKESPFLGLCSAFMLYAGAATAHFSGQKEPKAVPSDFTCVQMLSSAYNALKYSLIANRCVYLFQLPIYTQFLLGLLKTGSHFFSITGSHNHSERIIFLDRFIRVRKKYKHINTKNQKDAFPIDEIMTIFSLHLYADTKKTKMKQSFEANAKQKKIGLGQ